MDTYITKEGDTILSVAQLYGIRVIDLIQANNLEDVYFLEPGMELTIPTTQPLGYTYYTVQRGDTLYKIGQEFNIDPTTLAQINGLELNEYIFPNQKLLVPKEGVFAIITEEGDTMTSIYEKLGLNPDEVEILNRQIYLLPEQLITYRRRNS